MTKTLPIPTGASIAVLLGQSIAIVVREPEAVVGWVGITTALWTMINQLRVATESARKRTRRKRTNAKRA